MHKKLIPGLILKLTFFFRFTLVVFLFLNLQGCYQNVVLEQNIRVDAAGWNYNKELVFTTDIADTSSLFDIFINVRNNTEYPYSNLILFFTTEFPDGRLFKDTVECILADRTGKWTGSGFGNIKSNSFHFRKDVWFPQEGEHNFYISQGMREEFLQGIHDIGIRIERK
jgi:gliding motility-associated lipoprotein GldH